VSATAVPLPKPTATSEVLSRIRRQAMPKGVIGCRRIHLHLEGEMRLTPQLPWMRFNAEQVFTGCNLDFSYRAWLQVPPSIPARVKDSLRAGKAASSVFLLGTLPIFWLGGPSVGRHEAVRSLAELPWRPFTFGCNLAIAWEALGYDKLVARLDDGNLKPIEAVFDVDQDGCVSRCFVSDRPYILEKASLDNAWSQVFGDYQTFRDVRIPTTTEAVWHLTSGPFSYHRTRVTDYSIA
jgi:hypothetical protein